MLAGEHGHGCAESEEGKKEAAAGETLPRRGAAKRWVGVEARRRRAVSRMRSWVEGGEVVGAMLAATLVSRSHF